MEPKNPFQPGAKKASPKKAAEKALKSRKKPFAADTGNIFGSNRLEVPQVYMEEAQEMGCEVRWISAKELKEKHGHHDKKWIAWKFRTKLDDGILDSSRFAFGAGDSEGVVRRGDLVLAVRPVEVGDAHRQQLAEKRSIYNRFGAAKRKEYKDFVRSAMGKDAKAYEGYDED